MILSALVGLLLAAAGLSLAVEPAQAAGSGPLTCAATSTYYNYAVSGTLTNPNTPGGITVVTTHHTTVPRYSYTYTAISNAVPVLDNSYAGGSYLAAGLNAWRLGTGSYDNATYWLLVPTSTLGVVFDGRIVANTTQPLTLGCNAPAATGNTGAFTCSARLKTVTYTVAGTIAAPENPTDATLTRSGVAQGSHLSPRLDNTFWGGYWLTTYRWNSWAVQTDSGGNGVWLMIPNTPLSAAFSGMILIQYAAAGNNQLPATCSFV
jgi:hypothetical protein